MSEIKTSTLNTGDSLQNGKYRIEKIIGQGGFGITYEAVHTSLHSRYAIKEFFLSGFCIRTTSNTVTPQSISLEKFTDFKSKFFKEAQTLAKFKHNNIVKVLDIFEENETIYILMDFIEGKTLKELISQNNKLSESLSINYITQIASAVDEMHKNNLLHRDLKPDNIIIDKTGNAVLIDFGTARDFADGKTITHTAMLTPGYAPPEQYSERRKRGAFTDIYSLGATLYCCLTGEKPLQATDRTDEDDDTIDHITKPRDINSSITKLSESVILKSLSLKTADRYQSITEFLSALQGEYVPKAPEKKPETIDDKTIILNKDDDKTQLNQNFDSEKIYEQEAKTKFVPKHEPHHPIPPDAFDKKKNKKGWLIAIIAIVVLGLGAWYFISSSLNEQAYETAINSGNTKFEAKSFGEAINYYNEALGIKPNDPTATEKLKQANDSIEFNYSNCIAQGDSYKAIPSYAEAKTAYTKAIAWKPSDAIAQAKLKELDSLQAQEAVAKAKAETEAKLLAEAKAKEDSIAKATGTVSASNFAGSKGSFTDPRDGKTYKTVKIGNQVWMAENLAYKPSSGNYWAYDNNQSNVSKYGYLYDWATAKKVAPPGWHLPSDAEWTQLTNYLGGEEVAGGKLKATTGWNSPNTGATNSSGFTALPGGYRGNGGTFYFIGDFGYWWSSTAYGATFAWTRVLGYDSSRVYRYYGSKVYGFSVRCVRD